MTMEQWDQAVAYHQQNHSTSQPLRLCREPCCREAYSAKTFGGCVEAARKAASL